MAIDERINHPEDLTHDEIIEIIHSKHVTREQLNIFAAHARHLNAGLIRDLDKLDKITKSVEAKLNKLNKTG